MKLEREHVRHVAVRARELADGQLIALCNEALHEPDGGATERLAELVESTLDLMEWMRDGARGGYKRPYFDRDAAAELAVPAPVSACDSPRHGAGTDDACDECDGNCTNTLALCERRGEVLRAAIDEIDCLRETLEVHFKPNGGSASRYNVVARLGVIT